MKFIFDFFFANRDDDLNIGLKHYKQNTIEVVEPVEDRDPRAPGFLSFANNSF